MKWLARGFMFVLNVFILQQSTVLARSYQSVCVEDFTHLVKEQVYQGISKYVKKALWISPYEVDQQLAPVVYIAIHGTWGRTSPDFSDDNHFNFKELKQFVGAIALKCDRPALLLSFVWSGKDNEGRRKSAGVGLARLINFFSRKQDAHSVHILAHSHGGNVALYASRLVARKIDSCIFIATPRRNQVHYEPGRIKQIYNFYSTSDPIQIAGAVVKENLIESLNDGANRRKQPHVVECNTVNIDTKINAQSPGHIIIKDKLLPVLHDIIELIDHKYIIHNDLICDVCYLSQFPTLTMAINSFIPTDKLVTMPQLESGSLSNFFMQCEKEIIFSREQEKKFWVLYPKIGDIRSKDSMFERISHVVTDVCWFIYKKSTEWYSSFLGNEDTMMTQEEMVVTSSTETAETG